MTWREVQVELHIDPDPRESTGTVEDRHRRLLDRIADKRGLTPQQLAAQGPEAIARMITDHLAKAINPDLLESFLQKYAK